MECITSESAATAERAAAEFIARHLIQAVRERGRRRAALSRLFDGDTAIPASHVRRDRATCFTDREAAPAS